MVASGPKMFRRRPAGEWWRCLDGKQNGMQSHGYHRSSAASGNMFGATNPTCGDWCAGTVIAALRWVKCPSKTKQAQNIHNYGKSTHYFP